MFSQVALRQLVAVIIEAESWSNLTNVDRAAVGRLAEFHQLQGLLFIVTGDPVFEKAWSQQRLEAALQFDQLEWLESQFLSRGLTVARLKGASIIPRIFPDPGARHMCDVDLLVKVDQLGEVENFLREKGFIYQPVIPWRASKYRRSWQNPHASGLPLSVDLHTRIFWDEEPGLSEKWIQDDQGFFRLPDDLEALHLLVNWIEQDTCVGFNKMVDIYFYLKHFVEDFDWNSWARVPHIRRHSRSLVVAKKILQFYFHWPWPIDVTAPAWVDKTFDRYVAGAFLSHPHRKAAPYFLFKHLTKNFTSALLYDLLWGRAHFGPLTRRFFLNAYGRLNHGK